MSPVNADSNNHINVAKNGWTTEESDNQGYPKHNQSAGDAFLQKDFAAHLLGGEILHAVHDFLCERGVDARCGFEVFGQPQIEQFIF